jgi:uncharacterized protein YggE
MRITVLLLLLFPATFFAQQKETSDNIPSIEVIGTAEKELAPNKITIGITLQEEMGKNKTTIDQLEAALKAGLKDNKLDVSKLLVQRVNSFLYRINRKTNEVNNRRDYLMTVGGSEEAFTVFRVLDELNVKEAKIVELSHTDIINERSEVKKMALVAAKTKAAEMLKAIGETIDKPLLIREVEEDGAPVRPYLSNVAVGFEKSKYESADGYLELQPIKLKYMMYAKFKIK